MFTPDDILYEDNHLIVVNKHIGDLVQADPSGESGIEDAIKAFLKERGGKPGDAFLGVVHRIDRPVSGVVIFAKKALTRLNEMIRNGEIHKTYWAITETRLTAQAMPAASTPGGDVVELKHYILRDPKSNKSKALDAPVKEAKEARLRYKIAASSDRYTLLEVELLTGRHHQIRAQLTKIGCPIKGDLKYGAKRSNPDGGIALHSRRVEFVHPVHPAQATASPSCGGASPRGVLKIEAPVPNDNLWNYFQECLR